MRVLIYFDVVSQAQERLQRETKGTASRAANTHEVDMEEAPPMSDADVRIKFEMNSKKLSIQESKQLSFAQYFSYSFIPSY